MAPILLLGQADLGLDGQSGRLRATAGEGVQRWSETEPVERGRPELGDEVAQGGDLLVDRADGRADRPSHLALVVGGERGREGGLRHAERLQRLVCSSRAQRRRSRSWPSTMARWRARSTVRASRDADHQCHPAAPTASRHGM
jgi:hypothetical protein